MVDLRWLGYLGLGLLGACASKGVPVAAPVSGNAVVILVPKDVEGGSDPLKGVGLNSVDRVTDQVAPVGTYTNNPIKDFYSLTSTVPTPGQLVTEVCQGEQYSNGTRDKSCVRYQASLAVEEKPEGYQLTITPRQVITQKGRNAIGVGLDLPKFDIGDWYQHILDERVKSHYRVVSKFSPEAVKASFDRHFKQAADTQGEINGALKQFTTQYDYQGGDSTNARVTAAVSPGQDGSVVECDIELTAKPTQGVTSLNWSTALLAVRQELDRAATE